MKWGVALGNAAGSGMNAYLAISQAMRQQEKYDREKAAEDAYNNYNPTAIPEGFDPNVPFKQDTARAPVYQNPTAPVQGDTVSAGVGIAANQVDGASGGISRAAQTSRVALQQGPQKEPILQNMVDVSAITNPGATGVPAAPTAAPKPAMDNGMYVPERRYRDNVAAAKSNKGAEVLTYGTDKSPSALLRQKADLWEQGAAGNPARAKIMVDAEKMRKDADRMEEKEQKEMMGALNISAQRGDYKTFFNVLSNHLPNGEVYTVDGEDKAKGTVTLTVRSSVDPNVEPYQMTMTRDQILETGKSAYLSPKDFHQNANEEHKLEITKKSLADNLNLDRKKLDALIENNGMSHTLDLLKIWSVQQGKSEAYSAALAKGGNLKFQDPKTGATMADQSTLAKLAGDDMDLANAANELIRQNPSFTGNAIGAVAIAKEMRLPENAQNAQTAIEYMKIPTQQGDSFVPVYVKKYKDTKGNMHTVARYADADAYLLGTYGKTPNPVERSEAATTLGKTIVASTATMTPQVLLSPNNPLLNDGEKASVLANPATLNNVAQKAWDRAVQEAPTTIKALQQRLISDKKLTPAEALVEAKRTYSDNIQQLYFGTGASLPGLGELLSDAKSATPKPSEKPKLGITPKQSAVNAGYEAQRKAGLATKQVKLAEDAVRRLQKTNDQMDAELKRKGGESSNYPQQTIDANRAALAEAKKRLQELQAAK